jgi:hypothetical protein
MDMTSEQQLWHAVLYRQILDACCNFERKCADSENYRINLRDNARDYLLGHSKGLREVCDLAGIDFKTFKKGVERIKDSGWVIPRDNKEKIVAMFGSIHKFAKQNKLKLNACYNYFNRNYDGQNEKKSNLRDLIAVELAVK